MCDWKHNIIIRFMKKNRIKLLKDKYFPLLYYVCHVIIVISYYVFNVDILQLQEVP